MDQGTIVEAVSSHLDSLESIFNWAILLAIAVAWAGIQRQQQIEALGLKLKRRDAFFALSALFLVANVAVLILLLRVGDLLALVDAEHFGEALARAATHTWILNPFACFGDGWAGRLTSGEGFGLLIVVWWLCNAALHSILDGSNSHVTRVLLFLFLGVGLASMLAIQRVYGIGLERAEGIDAQLHAAIASTTIVRMVGCLLGTGVGALLFLNALRLRAARQYDQLPKPA